jgi:hypothetical protein
VGVFERQSLLKLNQCLLGVSRIFVNVPFDWLADLLYEVYVAQQLERSVIDEVNKVTRLVLLDDHRVREDLAGVEHLDQVHE